MSQLGLVESKEHLVLSEVMLWDAVRATYANEAARVYLKSQPKTYFRPTDENSEEYDVLRTPFPTQNSLANEEKKPEPFQAKLNSGMVSNLAAIMIHAITMRDVDLSTESIKIIKNENGHWELVKLGFNDAMGEENEYEGYKVSFKISSALLNHLPYLHGGSKSSFLPCTWVDFLQKGVFQPSELFGPHDIDNQHFRRELFKAILNCLLTPNEFIRAHINCITDNPHYQNSLFTIHSKSKQDFLAAAKDIQGFPEYIQEEFNKFSTDKAGDISDLRKSLQDFVPNNREYPLAADLPNVQDALSVDNFKIAIKRILTAVHTEVQSAENLDQWPLSTALKEVIDRSRTEHEQSDLIDGYDDSNQEFITKNNLRRYTNMQLMNLAQNYASYTPAPEQKAFRKQTSPGGEPPSGSLKTRNNPPTQFFVSVPQENATILPGMVPESQPPINLQSAQNTNIAVGHNPTASTNATATVTSTGCGSKCIIL